MSIAPMVHPGTQQRDTMGSIADSADLPSLSPSSSFLESPSSSLSQDIEGFAPHIVGSLSRSPSGLLGSITRCTALRAMSLRPSQVSSGPPCWPKESRRIYRSPRGVNPVGERPPGVLLGVLDMAAMSTRLVCAPDVIWDQYYLGHTGGSDSHRRRGAICAWQAGYGIR